MICSEHLSAALPDFARRGSRELAPRVVSLPAGVRENLAAAEAGDARRDASAGSAPGTAAACVALTSFCDPIKASDPSTARPADAAVPGPGRRSTPSRDAHSVVTAPIPMNGTNPWNINPSRVGPAKVKTRSEGHQRRISASIAFQPVSHVRRRRGSGSVSRLSSPAVDSRVDRHAELGRAPLDRFLGRNRDSGLAGVSASELSAPTWRSRSLGRHTRATCLSPLP